jgi:hypothetical protein
VASKNEGYDEAGVYVEVLPTQSKVVQFEWTVPRAGADKDKPLFLYFRKQPGVSMPFGLTVDGVAKYNTGLSVDFEKEIRL